VGAAGWPAPVSPRVCLVVGCGFECLWCGCGQHVNCFFVL